MSHKLCTDMSGVHRCLPSNSRWAFLLTTHLRISQDFNCVRITRFGIIRCASKCISHGLIFDCIWFSIIQEHMFRVQAFSLVSSISIKASRSYDYFAWSRSFWWCFVKQRKHNLSLFCVITLILVICGYAWEADVGEILSLPNKHDKQILSLFCVITIEEWRR